MWHGLLGRQSMLSTQTRFQMTRVPPIDESAVVAPAQNRSVVCMPDEYALTTSPLTFGFHAARTDPPRPLPTTHEQGLSPAKQPMVSQLAPPRHDAGTDRRLEERCGWSLAAR